MRRSTGGRPMEADPSESILLPLSLTPSASAVRLSVLRGPSQMQPVQAGLGEALSASIKREKVPESPKYPVENDSGHTAGAKVSQRG